MTRTFQAGRQGDRQFRHVETGASGWRHARASGQRWRTGRAGPDHVAGKCGEGRRSSPSRGWPNPGTPRPSRSSRPIAWSATTPMAATWKRFPMRRRPTSEPEYKLVMVTAKPEITVQAVGPADRRDQADQRIETGACHAHPHPDDAHLHVCRRRVVPDDRHPAEHQAAHRPAPHARRAAGHQRLVDRQVLSNHSSSSLARPAACSAPRMPCRFSASWDRCGWGRRPKEIDEEKRLRRAMTRVPSERCGLIILLRHSLFVILRGSSCDLLTIASHSGKSQGISG